MDPKLPPVIKMVGEEFDKAKPGVAIRSAHVGMGRSRNTYVFLTEVLPARHQENMAASIRMRCARRRWRSHFPRAAPCWASESSSTASACRWPARTSARFSVVIQYIDDRSYVVWPKSQAQRGGRAAASAEVNHVQQPVKPANE